ncbi:hypothetical protein R3P38DRAFT_2757895 [Favolaschia claudopus]|uniref:Uncharacterized protein n=1 Tax=Favolaschia claudopus TaxID=2862362 RepID=A0AAW0ED26_9AGAR
MNQRFFALFVLLFVAVAVVAAPVNIGDDSLEARAAKKVAVVKKPVVKKPVVAKPVAKTPVAKPAAKPVVKPVAKPVTKPATVPAAKPATKPVTKPVTKPATKPVAAPVTSCPIPKKTAVRRFLEYVGFARTTPVASCPTISTPSVPSVPAPAASAKVDKKAAKASAAAAKSASKSAAAAAASASAAAAKRPIGAVANAPTRAVRCNDKTGATTDIPLAAIQTAVSLAQAGPLVVTKNAVKFPHVFNNREGVRVAAACAGKVLEEQAVGPDMSTFQNIPSILGNFNEFRVLITTPDATTGATTFCGVMTHGASTTGTFDKDLCTEI